MHEKAPNIAAMYFPQILKQLALLSAMFYLDKHVSFPEMFT
jgi:hypothetical protein